MSFLIFIVFLNSFAALATYEHHSQTLKLIDEVSRLTTRLWSFRYRKNRNSDQSRIASLEKDIRKTEEQLYTAWSRTPGFISNATLSKLSREQLLPYIEKLKDHLAFLSKQRESEEKQSKTSIHFAGITNTRVFNKKTNSGSTKQKRRDDLPHH